MCVRVCVFGILKQKIITFAIPRTERRRCHSGVAAAAAIGPVALGTTTRVLMNSYDFRRFGEDPAPRDPETEDVDRPEGRDAAAHDVDATVGGVVVAAGPAGRRVVVVVVGEQPDVCQWRRRRTYAVRFQRPDGDDAPVQTAVALRATVLPVDQWWRSTAAAAATIDVAGRRWR